MNKACFSRTLVHKNFKNHFYPDPTRFPGPQTKYCPGEDLSHFRHTNLTPDRGIKYRNKSFKSTRSSFMSDIMAETMVAEFKRLPQRAYLRLVPVFAQLSCWRIFCEHGGLEVQ